MSDITLSLSPSGDIRLHLPTGRQRFVDVTASEAGARFIVKILRDQASGKRDDRGYIGEFPTQHIIDAWLRADAQTQAKEAAERARTEASMRGIDLNKVEFKL